MKRKEKIKNNDMYLYLYKMLVNSLNENDIDVGVLKTLDMTKDFLDIDDIILFRKYDIGYIRKYKSSLVKEYSDDLSIRLDYCMNNIQCDKYYKLNLDTYDAQTVVFIPIECNKTEYMCVLLYKKYKFNIDEDKLDLFTGAIKTVLDKLEMTDSLNEYATKDSLTKLENRNVYDNFVNKTAKTSGLIYVLFDLFRLKYINDNYSHLLGDEYIVKSAEILRKYFPKNLYVQNLNGDFDKTYTGTNLYRIGGDEFAVISSTETLESLKIKAKLIKQEIRNLNLGISEPLGINYGFAKSENNDTLKGLYLKADKMLANNKKEAYKVLELEKGN